MDSCASNLVLVTIKAPVARANLNLKPSTSPYWPKESEKTSQETL